MDEQWLDNSGLFLDVRNESSTESVVVKKGRESPENILSNLSNELYTEKIILLESKQNLIILKKE